MCARQCIAEDAGKSYVPLPCGGADSERDQNLTHSHNPARSPPWSRFCSSTIGKSPLSGAAEFVTRRTRLATESHLTLVALDLQGKRVTHLQTVTKNRATGLQELRTWTRHRQLTKKQHQQRGQGKRILWQPISAAQSASSPIPAAACRPCTRAAADSSHTKATSACTPWPRAP